MVDTELRRKEEKRPPKKSVGGALTKNAPRRSSQKAKPPKVEGEHPLGKIQSAGKKEPRRQSKSESEGQETKSTITSSSKTESTKNMPVKKENGEKNLVGKQKRNSGTGKKTNEAPKNLNAKESKEHTGKAKPRSKSKQTVGNQPKKPETAKEEGRGKKQSLAKKLATTTENHNKIKKSMPKAMKAAAI